MDRIDVVFKAGFTFIGGVISWMVGGLGVAFVVLLGLMVIDFLTGLMVGYSQKDLNSGKGKDGLMKKTYILLLIGAVYMIQKAIPALSSLGYAADGVAIAYCVIEFLSIVENGGKLGVPTGPLKNVITALKQKGTDK
jgi:toxin secretion/phage lysis holin